MTPVAEGLSPLTMDVAMSVEVDVEAGVELVKVVLIVFVLFLEAEVVELIVLELDAVPGPMGKCVCTEAVVEATVKDDMFEDRQLTRDWCKQLARKISAGRLSRCNNAIARE
jgi:hypothetical protein